MKRFWVFGLLFIIAPLVGIAQQGHNEARVLALAQIKNNWLIAPNLDSLGQLLDNRCLYIHSNGWIQTAADVIADLESGKIIYEDATISESEARQFGGMVIVTGWGHFAGWVNGKAFDMNLAFTEVYVSKKGGWKLVSRHSNRVD